MLKRFFFYSLFFLFATKLHANCATVNASFTTSQTTICGPGVNVIGFTNTSTGANAATVDYEWFLNGVSFDNTTGLAAPNNSTISAVGTYTYMLIATDPSVPCADTATVIVRILPLPNANFTFNPNNACAGTNISFTNTSTGNIAGTTYQWNFGDLSTATTTNATHAYAAGGTYNVTLTMTNAAGCTDAQTFAVTAMDIPAVSFTGDDGDGNTSNCLLPGDPTTSETVTFTNTTTGAVSYAWDFGDGNTSTAANPTHTYTNFGTYTVTLTATHANGCTATSTITVVFEKFVSAAMTLNITEYSGCLPHELTTLTNLSVNANTYTWNFGDGSPAVTTTSIIPPNHVYNTAGTYTISLTASNSCNTAMATISPIVIVAGPTANFNLSTTLGCAPQTITFGNTTTGAQPANNYQWNMGNGNTYTNVVNPPAQTYNAAGTYTVTLIAGNACGYDTITTNVIINTPPIADITVNPLIGCTPLTVAVTNNSTGNMITNAWFVDGNYAGAAANIGPLTFTAPAGNNPQNHTVSLTVSNNCGSDNDAETIVVHPQTVAQFNQTALTICAGQNITFTDNSLGSNLTWNWNFGNGNTAAAQGPHTINYPIAGTYNVTLIVNGFCGPDTLVKVITVNPIPVASITPPVSNGCAPLSVPFTNNSTLGGTYAWTFASGTPATSNVYAPAPVNFATAGTHMVILNVSVLGCVNADTAFVTVNPLPVPAFTIVPNNGCIPLTTTFNNTTAVTGGETFDWDFGNGNVSALQNPPAQLYNSAGTYAVELIVTTAAGCSDSVTTNVTAHPLPVAIFDALPDTVCATTPIAFLNNSTGATTYAWAFGDGGTSTLNSPSHTYTTQGSFTAQLIATTAFNCKDTAYATIVVDSIPTANFGFSIECAGDTTQFTDLSTGGITAWAWNFGDGSPTDNTANPAHLYAANGSYNVVLTVTNPAGCTNNIAQLVTVNLVPVASFNANTFCLGQTTQFNDATTGVPIGWNWDFDDGNTSTLQNPSNVFAATGTYNVTLIASAGSGCSDTVTLPVTITGIPTADFTFTSVCATELTQFNSTSLGAPDTYVWNFGDGNTDNTNNPSPTHTYATAGTYNVTLTAGYAASGCTHSITLPVDAFPRTVPSYNNNTPCLGAATNFNDLTTGTPNTWTWDFGDGSPADTVQNPSHTYNAFGTYAVQLITENAFGCIDSITTNITVNPLPVAGFSFDTVCAGFTTVFTDLSASAVNYNWDFGDGSPDAIASSPTHVYTLDGTYNVAQIVFNSFGCSDTLVQQITVNPNPIASFNANISCHTYPSQFTDASTGAVQWNWNFGDGSPQNTNTNPVYTYANDGTYNTTLIVFNVFGCSDTITNAVTVLPQPQAAFINNTVCAGQTVQFTDQSTGSPITFSWDFGDGSPLSTAQNPTYNYATGGQYNITFIVGNPAGCADTVVVPVDVYTVPTPAFTADTVCLFNVTTFTDLSTDAVAITSWFWDFGDGNNSFSQHPNYIYANPGTYNVTLTITNVNGCDTSITQPVVVSDIPVAAFTADTVCLGSATTFTDISTGIPTSWTWNFGDGNVINGGPVEQHVYAAPGQYLVQFVVSGGGGVCTDQTFGIVTVSTDAVAGTILPDTVCTGTNFAFSDNSTITSGTITSYTWDMGDGTIYTTANGNHTYAAPGNYIVSYTVTSSGGCTSTETDTIVVNQLPTAQFAANAVCVNQGMQFTDLSSGAPGIITQWDWDFDDGNTSNIQNPLHTYTNAGVYDVILTVTTNGGCTSTTHLLMEVYDQPNAAFTAPTVCWGSPVNFTDNSTAGTSGTINTWDWDFGDASTGSNTQNPSHVFATYDDAFTVTLVITTNEGCSDTAVQTVTTLPIVNWNFFPDVVNGCAPLEVAFTDSSTISSGNIVGWVWDFGDGLFSFNQHPNHTYPNDGAYFVTLSVTTSAGCVYTNTLPFPVTVYPQPVAAFSLSPLVTSINQPLITVTDESIDAVAWEYSFGDDTYSNLSNPTHYYTTSGIHTIMQIVTNQYGCHDTVQQSVQILDEFTFYTPNAFTPDGDDLNEVFYGTGTGIVEYQFMVFDRWGELLYETTSLDGYWDGTFKGIQCKNDVYVWKAICKDLNGEVHEFYGHVTLLR